MIEEVYPANNMVDIDAVMQEVNQQEGLSFQRSEKESPYIAMYSGGYHSYGQLKIGFLPSFPRSLPAIFVFDPTTPRLHVDSKGKICLTDESSLLLDENKPTQLIIECLKLAERVLSLIPGSAEYQDELKKEFLFYWGLREHGITIWSILPIVGGTSIQQASLFRFGKSYILAPSIADANSFLCDHYGFPPLSDPEKCKKTAWVIPLKEDATVPSPFVTHNWSDVIGYFKENSAEETRQQFWELTNPRVKKFLLHLIFVIPASSGDIVFGFVISINNKHRLPIKASLTRMVLQVNVVRYDYDFLLSRCCATPSLKDKRVLLLGCGSVGGFLANNLCQMGVSQLDILDKDIFSAHNIHRHFMGFEALKQPATDKADLLRNVLNEKYAYLDIDSLNYVDRSVEHVILEDPNRLAQYDLIISALGEPTLNLAINDLLIERNIQVPFIACFNEPYGIGGHVITTNLSNESCLRCFYSDPTYGTLCSFRGSLVASGQNFKKSLSGCSGTFVPYSTLDSQQTAIHAARKAVAVLTGALTHNDFYTWRGDATLLESHGFRVSAYFGAGPLSEQFVNPQCPTCKRRNSKP